MEMIYENPVMSHFQYTTEVREGSQLIDLKQQAFRAMNQLEGWCTHHKASVLMDLVLMTQSQKIVEIGVWGGKSLIPMAYALRFNGSGQIYGIDPWDHRQSIIGMDGVNKNWWGSINHEAILSGLMSKIKKFGLENQIVLIQSTSKEAEPIMDIDILHIDGNHSEEASLLDVTKWVPLVRKGGFIIFDDLTWENTTTKAVEWVDETCIKLAEFRGSNVWGIWVKP